MPLYISTPKRFPWHISRSHPIPEDYEALIPIPILSCTTIPILEKLEKFHRQGLGRPRLEYDQQSINEVIINIVNEDASADDRRRTETLNIPTTL